MVAWEAGIARCVGMSAAADPAITYNTTPSTLKFSTFNDLSCVTADMSGGDFVTFHFQGGHVTGTVGVRFSDAGTGTLLVSSTAGGSWTTTASGDIIVNVDETSGSPFAISATLARASGSGTLSSGAANLLY